MLSTLTDLFSLLPNFVNQVWLFIIKLSLNSLSISIQLIFGWIHLPDMPEPLKYTIENFFNLIFQNISLANFFLPIPTIVILISLSSLLFAATLSLRIVKFIIRRTPFKILFQFMGMNV